MPKTLIKPECRFKHGRIPSKRFEYQKAWIVVEGVRKTVGGAADRRKTARFNIGSADRIQGSNLLRPTPSARTGAPARATAHASKCGTARKPLKIKDLRCPTSRPIRFFQVTGCKVYPAQYPNKIQTDEQYPKTRCRIGYGYAPNHPSTDPIWDTLGDRFNDTNATPFLSNYECSNRPQKINFENRVLTQTTTKQNSRGRIFEPRKFASHAGVERRKNETWQK